MSEGGEARYHEAEVEAVAKELAMRLPPNMATYATVYAQVAIAALDAVRRSPHVNLTEFQEGLTRALNRHGVPAMPSWDAAIDWLAEHGGRSPQGEDDEVAGTVEGGIGPSDIEYIAPIVESPEVRPHGEDHEAGQDFTRWFTDYPSTHRLAGQTVEVTPVRPSPERNTEAEVERLREALETIQALSADDAEIARKALEGPSDV